MRIIAGSARGRRLAGPGKGGRHHRIRPTSDRAREAVFNLLRAEIAGAFVLDLFAGTGAMALEALSRGAEKAVLVDNNPGALDLIKRNTELCSFEKRAVCKRADLAGELDLLEQLRPEPGFSLVFMDPPYHMPLAGSMLEKISRRNILAEEAVVVVEIRSGEELPHKAGDLILYDQRSYGEAGFWFYSVKQDEDR
ncbi:MAG: 16S rRNA (guanine(966)-N(2))-methyltransferase RsmD [Desulfurivibrionaceae bacterium]